MNDLDIFTQSVIVLILSILGAIFIHYCFLGLAEILSRIESKARAREYQRDAERLRQQEREFYDKRRKKVGL